MLERTQHARVTNAWQTPGSGEIEFVWLLLSTAHVPSAGCVPAVDCKSCRFADQVSVTSACRPDALSGHRAKRVLASNQAGPSGDPSKRRHRYAIPGVPAVGRAPAPRLHYDASKKGAERRCDRNWPRLIFFQEPRPSIQPCIRAVDARVAHCAVPSTLRSR